MVTDFPAPRGVSALRTIDTTTIHGDHLPGRTPDPLGLALGFALLGKLLLFLIDEGLYTLSGLEQPGNMLTMGFYPLGLLVGFLGVKALFAKRPSGVGRTANHK